MESKEIQKIDQFIHTREDGTREQFKVITTNHLTKNQINDVNQVVNECLNYDNLERTLYLSNDLNYFINLHCFYLLYKDNRLVSVITIFQPLEREAELSAYTLPIERRKGYFSYLLDLAEDELVDFHIVRILFVVEPSSKSGIKTIEALNAEYKMSEYLLSYDLSKQKNTGQLYQLVNNKHHNHRFILQELGDDTLSLAIKLSCRIFNTELEEAEPLLVNTVNSKTVKSYLVYLDHDLIGICNVNFGVASASLYGLGIDPMYRGKGYGKMLLHFIIDKIIEETGHESNIEQDIKILQDRTFSMNDIKHKIKYITLEVGSENQVAYTMYRNFGFEIRTQYDYYKYVIELEDGFDSSQ
jgi:ribosomal protein S18 acetylase RimI-like enzyme